MTESSSNTGSTLLRLLLTALLAGGAALAANFLLLPPAARYVFSKKPPVDIQKIEEQKNEMVEGVALSIMASMLGPPESAPPAELAEEEASGDAPDAPAAEPEEPADQADDPDPATRAADDPTPPVDPSPPPADPAPESTPESEVPAETPVFEVDRRELNRRLRKPGIVSQKIATVATKGRDGLPTGLHDRKLDGFYGKFGLRIGDIVTAVNGRDITDRQSAIKHLAKMREETTFLIDVQREGRTFQIEYRVPLLQK
jgi:membrane-associated protease RseP (regulator of RpoE activity)